MVRLRIDHKTVEIREGSPVILAARNAGIHIPAMCWREGKEHITSCMICLVKDASSQKLFPSCSVEAREGMEVITMDDEIREARKTALELLLSEHVGDCEAPCQITCPAHMNIPGMNRLLARGEFDAALRLIKKDIALPASFGRICQAPCEGACRRKSVDETISICLLKRAAGDENLGEGIYFIPPLAPTAGKKVAVIGAGPAGLASAYYLQQKGYECVVFDRNPLPGGSLMREVKEGALPADILEKEIAIIEKLGARFSLSFEVDAGRFKKILEEYDAVLIACGNGNTGVSDWGLEMTEKGIAADQQTCRLGESRIFVAGSALKPSKMAIRALGQGKEAAFSIDQFLQGKEVKGEVFRFNSRFGKLMEEEILEYLKESVEGKQVKPAVSSSGFTKEEVMKEAERCLHCDCREIDNCLLRIYSGEYQADQKRFKSEERKKIRKFVQHDILVYEPAKCIKCGICVEITASHREELGLGFIGRGFDIEIAVPFMEGLDRGIKKVAVEVAEGCPVGALSLKNK